MEAWRIELFQCWVAAMPRRATHGCFQLG